MRNKKTKKPIESKKPSLENLTVESDFLKKITQKRLDVKAKESQYEASSAQAKSDKAELNESILELMQLIDDFEKPVPLFDNEEA